MRKRTFSQVVLIVTALALPCPAGIIVVDHQPHNTGGPASDTEFIVPEFPNNTWQRVADDFILAQPATIRHVNWWGFYHLDNPPAEEIMRIRFYGSRPGDGLPDDNDIIYEESFTNPSRAWTGRQVFTGILPREYLFQVNLANPLPLVAESIYWLEVVQVGDAQSAFRWEFSIADLNGHAFINSTTVDWRGTTTLGDMAFQLLVPEPATAVLLTLVTIALLTRRRILISNRRRFREFKYRF